MLHTNRKGDGVTIEQLEQSWKLVQVAADVQYKMSRQAKRPIYPGYTGTVLRAISELMEGENNG